MMTEGQANTSSNKDNSNSNRRTVSVISSIQQQQTRKCAGRGHHLAVVAMNMAKKNQKNVIITSKMEIN